MSDRPDPSSQPATGSTGGVAESTATPLPEMSPALLRRLGEAAAGFPDATPYWWTARLKPADGDFDQEKHPNPEAAASSILGMADRGVVGPIVAPYGPGGIVQTNVIRVTIEFDEGDPLVLCGKDYDAVFWGFPAVEKFVIPYYVSVSGVEYGQRILKSAAAGDLILAHAPDTEYRIFHLPLGLVRGLTPLL